MATHDTDAAARLVFQSDIARARARRPADVPMPRRVPGETILDAGYDAPAAAPIPETAEEIR